MVVVIDDLHDADAATLQVLRFLARAVKDSRILLIGTHRDAEVERLPELRSAIAELARESNQLVLHGLNLTDTTDLARARTGIAPTGQLNTILHHTTAGNPLFLSGVVQMLASVGKLEHQEWLIAADLKLPANVRGSINSRLGQLSQHTNAMISVAAVIGIEFDIALLARLLDLLADEILRRLDEAIALGVIESVPASPISFRFTHPLVRLVIYDAMGAAERARLHKQIGEALEAIYGREPSAHLAQMANHFQLAVPSGIAEKAVTYSIRTAEPALAVFAYIDQYDPRGNPLVHVAGQVKATRITVDTPVGDVL
jgi:predicted ATPase